MLVTYCDKMIAFRLVFCLFILLSYGGCHKPESSYPKQSNKILCISIPFDLESLDPRHVITYPSIFPIKMAFEGLMYVSPDGKVKPAIAETVDISENQKLYTFHLRSCKWSNGDEVTAYDFEYAWKTLLDPELNTKGKHNFYAIKNAKAVVLGQLPIDTLGIKVIDSKTLIVELEHPTPYFLEVVATSSFFPINPRVDKQTPHWAGKDVKEFVGNGPFILTSRKWDNELIFMKNPDYWDAEHVPLPGIKIYIVKDPTTVLNLFEKGELDWAGKPLSVLPLDAISTLKREGKIFQFPCAGLEWYFFNIHSFPFNNKKMRQAFAYAINRQAITDYVLQEGETPALSILPANLTTQTEPYFSDHNSFLASQLFNEALQELGIEKKDLPEIVLNYSTVRVTTARVAEAIQQQWQQTFDIPIQLQQLDGKVHYSNLLSGDFQIGVMSWLSWLRDPIYFLQTFRFAASHGVNFSKWEHPEYQTLLYAIEEELDTAKRRQLINRAEKILADEFPVIPIYNTTVSYMKNEKLKNVFVSDFYEIDFRWAYFED